MDDDRKRPPRGKPPRSGGGARPSGGQSGRFRKNDAPGGQGKGGKPFAKRDGDQARSAKPAYTKRRDAVAKEGVSGEGGRKPFVKRDYGDRGPRRDGDSKPFVKRDFSKGPRRESGERKPESGEGKPFVKREYKPREGAERAFRGDRPAGEGAERKPFVKRDFSKGPRREGGERKFERSERPYRAERPADEGGERKPFVKRDFSKGPRREGGERKFERSERPYRAERPSEEGGERKPFVKREFKPREGGKSFGNDRPKRPFDKDRGERKFADKPSFGERKPFVRRDAEAVEEGERIAKRLARAGISSRRDAEELIAAGRVKVNGRVLETPAFNVGASDRIEVDDTEIPAIERTRLFLFHKPSGVVTTNRDPEGRKTVFDVLPGELPRLMTIGRLDINTEGLLLLTNDGGLSRVLELPATGWLRRYRVRVHGKVEEARLAELKDGIAVDGVFYGAVEAALEREQGSNAWLTIGLREGKNREVKNILGALGLEVTRLIRVSYGPFQLGELPEGHVLEIKGRMLREQLGERLIEESGANFDADICKPFSNKPVRRNDNRRPEPDERPARRPREVKVGEGGLIKGGFRRDREQMREELLGRLSTKPERGRFGGPRPERSGDDRKPFGGKPAGKSFGAKRGERDERPIEPPGGRKANVWMAPGARPQAKKPSERAAEKRQTEERGSAGKFSRPSGKPGGKPPSRGSDGPRGPKPGGRFSGKPPRKG